MSKSRKILGALLAVVLVLNVFAVSALASVIDQGILEAEGHSYSASMTLVGSTDTSATVKVVANYALGGIQFRLSGIKLSLDVSDVEVSGYYDHYDVHLNADGLVFILPDSTSAAGVPVLKPDTEVTITVKGTKTGTIAITGDAKTSATPTAENMALRLDGGTVQAATIYWGQTLTISNDGTTPTPPPATDVTLTGVGTGYVDEVRNYVYGVPARTKDLTPYFAATGTGVIEIVPTTVYNQNSGYGTGTVINLYSDSSKNNLVGSYTLIIFGDVNGDALIQIKDAKSIQDYANAVNTGLTDIAKFAANVNGDVNKNGELLIQIKDAKAVQDYANAVNLTGVSVNPWAS